MNYEVLLEFQSGWISGRSISIAADTSIQALEIARAQWGHLSPMSAHEKVDPLAFGYVFPHPTSTTECQRNIVAAADKAGMEWWYHGRLARYRLDGGIWIYEGFGLHQKNTQNEEK